MPAKQPQLKEVIKHTRLVEFQVQNKPFNYLSDHFAIETVLKYCYQNPDLAASFSFLNVQDVIDR